MTIKYLVTYKKMEGDNYAGGYVKYQEVVNTIDEAIQYDDFPIIPINLDRPLTHTEITKAKEAANKREKEEYLRSELALAATDLVEAQDRFKHFSNLESQYKRDGK